MMADHHPCSCLVCRTVPPGDPAPRHLEDPLERHDQRGQGGLLPLRRYPDDRRLADAARTVVTASEAHHHDRAREEARLTLHLP